MVIARAKRATMLTRMPPVLVDLLMGWPSEMAILVHHASNFDDPYLRESGANNTDDEDEDEDEENLDYHIKLTNNPIVVGHVHKDEFSVEFYVHGNRAVFLSTSSKLPLLC